MSISYKNKKTYFEINRFPIDVKDIDKERRVISLSQHEFKPIDGNFQDQQQQNFKT
jgi:hypothetical protein